MKKKGGYARYSVRKLTSPSTFGKVFPGKLSAREFMKEHYLCTICTKELRKRTVPAGNKRTWQDRASPPKTQHRDSPSNTPDSKVHKGSDDKETRSLVNMTTKDKAVAYLNMFKYKQAFVTLVEESECAREQFLEVYDNMIKTEVNTTISQ